MGDEIDEEFCAIGNMHRHRPFLKREISVELSEAERDTLDFAVNFVSAHTAKEISEHSHDEFWEKAEMGGDIDLSQYKHIPRKPLGPEAQKIAERTMSDPECLAFIEKVASEYV